MKLALDWRRLVALAALSLLAAPACSGSGSNAPGGGSASPGDVPPGAWLSFGQYSEGVFYDGHAAPATPGAVFGEPIRQSAGFGVSKSGAGALFHARNDDVTYDLYFLTF